MSWELVKLDDVCEIVGGTTPRTNNPDYWNGDIVWLSPVDLPEIGTITSVMDSGRKITELAVKESGLRILPINTVVFSTRASIGKIGIVGTPLTTNQGFNSLIPSNKVDSLFLAYALKSNIENISQLGNSTTFKEVSRSSFKEFKIPLPPLSTQKHIAAILDTADALRRKDQELLRKYDELAQAIFIDMFGDPVKNEKGWEIRKLGDICYSVKDGPHVSPKYTEQGVPFISVNNIIRGEIDIANCRYISEEDFKIYSSKGKPEKNDILYTKGGTTGFAKRVDVDFKFINWVHIAVLKFNQKEMNSIFFESMLNSIYCYRQSQKYTRGIANRDLVLGEMKKIEILYPPYKIQCRFANLIENIEIERKYIINTCSKSDSLFQSLLQKAFKGELIS